MNTDLFSNYADIASFQKMQAWNSVGGVPYGIPHGWGAQLLGFRTDLVQARAGLVERRLRPGVPVQGQDRHV